jgi:heme oxygenase (mycobilin-producing)
MAVVGYFTLIAKVGCEQELLQELLALAPLVRALPGCEAIEVHRKEDDERFFVLVERWTSSEAHEVGRSLLDPKAMTPAMALLAEPAAGVFLQPCLTI